jgi:hypothetical protein
MLTKAFVNNTNNRDLTIIARVIYEDNSRDDLILKLKSKMLLLYGFKPREEYSIAYTRVSHSNMSANNTM